MSFLLRKSDLVQPTRRQPPALELREYCEPAFSIMKRFGGPKEVARITGVTVTVPYHWRMPVERGGTGGWIPRKHHTRLLTYARLNSIPLVPADFWAPGA